MTDDAAMDTTTTSPGPTESQTPPPRPPLVRPVAGRMLGGVATGLANSLALPVPLVRFGFAFAALFAGLGVFLYVAGWLLIRDETESESVAARLISNIRSGPAWVGVALIALGFLLVIDRIGNMGGGILTPSRSFLWALLFVIVGVLLYRGDIGGARGGPPPPAPGHDDQPDPLALSPTSPTDASPEAGGDFVSPPPLPPAAYVPPAPAVPPPPPTPPSILGRMTIGIGLLALGILAILDNATNLVSPQPRHYLALATLVLGLGLLTGSLVGRARWLILIGVFVVPPLLGSPLAEVDWNRGLDRTISPTQPSELSSSYRQAVGRLTFDLSGFEWNGETAELNAELAAGELVVYVPEDVGIEGRGEVAVGQISGMGVFRGGIGDINRDFSRPGEAGTLVLDLEVGAGSIRIVDRPAFFAELTPLDASDLQSVDRPSGDLSIDLTSLSLDDDRELSVYIGTGDIDVIVPADLSVEVDAFSNDGVVDVFGDTSEWDSQVTASEVVPGDPVLWLYLQVDQGNITVERQP